MPSLTAVCKMGGVRPAFAPGLDSALEDSSLCGSAPPPHTLTCTGRSLLTSVLCYAGLQVLLLPQRQGFSGLWVGAWCAELRGSLRLGPGVCPGWFLGSRPSSAHGLSRSRWEELGLASGPWLTDPACKHNHPRSHSMLSFGSFCESLGTFPSRGKALGGLAQSRGLTMSTGSLRCAHGTAGHFLAYPLAPCLL